MDISVEKPETLNHPHLDQWDKFKKLEKIIIHCRSRKRTISWKCFSHFQDLRVLSISMVDLDFGNICFNWLNPKKSFVEPDILPNLKELKITNFPQFPQAINWCRKYMKSDCFPKLTTLDLSILLPLKFEPGNSFRSPIYQ